MYESEVDIFSKKHYKCSLFCVVPLFRVFCWFYVDVLLVFWGIPLVFQVVPLFHHCSGVFLCSAGVPYSVVPRCSAGVLCSGVPGFTVCLLFLLYSNVHKKTVCLKFFCDGKLIMSLFLF